MKNYTTPPNADPPTPLRLVPRNAADEPTEVDPLTDVPPPAELRRRVAHLNNRLHHTRRLLRLSEQLHRHDERGRP